MEITEVLEIFKYIEQKYNVDEWKINGIHIYPLIRLENRYLLSLMSLNGSAKVEATSNGYGLKILKAKPRRIKAQLGDPQGQLKLHQADVVFLGNGISFSKLNGSWYQKLCDPIQDALKDEKISCIRLEMSHNFLTPRHNPCKFIQTEVDNVIIKSIIASKIKAPQFEDEQWGDFESFCNDPYVKKKLLKLPTKELVRKRIAKIEALSSFYQKKLKKINPKIAFIPAYYGDQEISFIIACKRMGITTVDVQHGVQGKYHLGYGSWFKVASKGYTPLPDYFAVWSEQEKEAIQMWSEAVTGHDVVVTGNLFSELWKENNNPIVKKYDDEIAKLKKWKKKQTILLTLSPYTEKEMKLIYEVVKESQLEYNWFIRLHPSMIRNQEEIKNNFKSMGIKHFEIEQSSNLPLYSLLRNIDLHMTVQSSCVIEAADFGVQSIITSDYAAKLYDNWVKNGKAHLIKEKGAILTQLESTSSSKNGKYEVSNKLSETIDFIKQRIQ